MNQADGTVLAQDQARIAPTLRRLIGLVTVFRAKMALVSVLTMLIITAEIAEVRLIGKGFVEIELLAKRFVQGGHEEAFWSAVGGLRHPPTPFLREVRFLAIMILALAILRGAMTFANRMAFAGLTESVVWRLRSMLMAALQRLSFSYYDRNFSGQIINRATGDVQQIRRLVSVVWYNAFTTSVYLVGYSVLMLVIDPLLALVAVSMVPVAVWLLVRMARKLRTAFHESREREDDMVVALQENIAGVEVVKGFARERAEIEKFERLCAVAYDRVMVIVDLFRRNMPAIRALTRVNLAVVLGVGAAMVMSGSLMIGDLVIFTVAVGAIGQHLRVVIQITNQLQEALASGERVFEILDARPDVEEKPDARALPPGRGQVTFENVRFGYTPDAPVLHDISLEVRPGQVIALVGPTGAGKTTLMNLVLRFYDPTVGRVLIDGVDVRDAQLQSLRSSIGLVFQETFLFSDTVANNIAYGLPHADRDKVIAAARIARAHEFIEQLDSGYDTIIGERGVTLSGGQRQRLAIARAILKEPRILILDDAMASVDSATERKIAVELDGVFRDRTVFIIAHRLNSVRRADRVLVIENGRITQAGTHEELMATDGHYRELVALQLAGTDDAAALAADGSR